MPCRLFHRMLMTTLALAAGLPAQRAAADVEASFSVSGGGSPYDVQEQHPLGIVIDGADSSVADSFNPEFPTTTRSASAIIRAGHGLLRVAAYAELTGGESYQAGAGATATAAYTDTLTIDAPGQTGQHGVFAATMVLDGDLAEGVPAFEASYQSDARASAMFEATTVLGGDSDSRSLEGPWTSEEHLEIEVPFIFGDPFTVEGRLSLSASTSMPNFPGSSFAIADFFNTMAWTGPDYILDDAGAGLTDYTIESQSGTDYSQAIPEPGAATIFAACLGLILRRPRRAHRNKGAGHL